MARRGETVISASRRTDIPAFYLKSFMDGMDQGVFHVKNPYNALVKRVEVSPEQVHSIVFWSKNYQEFLSTGAGLELKRRGYNLLFNFTINSDSEVLEPGIPGLETRLDQLRRMSDRFGPETISWRFDPICFYTRGSGRVENNFKDFSFIAETAGKLGISRCITSFYDDYLKIRRRLIKIAPDESARVTFVDPGNEKKINLLLTMEQELTDYHIRLYTCCEKGLFSMLPETSEILESACIPGALLQTLSGGNPVRKRDYGQRAKKGCRCTRSVDIGSYEHHPCLHNCLYCYANPEMDIT